MKRKQGKTRCTADESTSHDVDADADVVDLRSLAGSWSRRRGTASWSACRRPWPTCARPRPTTCSANRTGNAPRWTRWFFLFASFLSSLRRPRPSFVLLYIIGPPPLPPQIRARNPSKTKPSVAEWISIQPIRPVPWCRICPALWFVGREGNEKEKNTLIGRWCREDFLSFLVAPFRWNRKSDESHWPFPAHPAHFLERAERSSNWSLFNVREIVHKSRIIKVYLNLI